MSDDVNTNGAPTRRDTIKYGGTLVGGGLLAGCTGDGDGDPEPSATPTSKATPTDTATPTETPTETATATDSSYEVDVQPYGAVPFDDVPESYVVMGSGAWPDIAFALAGEPAAMSKTYYPFDYYDALPEGASFDVEAVTDLGDVSALDVEQFYEIEADVHLVDKQLLASYASWSSEDFDQVEETVGPFAASYIRGEWSGEALGVEFSFPYYDLPGAIELVGEVFRERERATAWIDQLETFTSEIADPAPASSPSVGVVYSGSDAANGTFYLASPTAAGVGTYPYRALGVTNGFEAFTSEGTYQTDYEGLLETDPDYICVDSAISNMTTDEFQSQFVETMQDDPVGSELSAVQNDNVVQGCGRHQGPIIAHFETAAIAKQLHPDEFGTFDAESFPAVPADERLFDRQRLAELVTS